MKIKLVELFNNLEAKTKTIIKNGLKFCFIICIISLSILLTYNFIFSNPIIYNIGITLFQMSLFFSVEFLICGIVVDSLKKKIE